ncbi:hypothetical protein [Mesorhizobium huakuii]|uniref:hypothetical protein n=1 Tax=Mesorhizobium huakuii TaxID=28104 RepID=UPI001FD248D8|nr:hypothetical protein [Mesorhizobium huakuii]
MTVNPPPVVLLDAKRAAELHRLGSVTPHYFFKELERAGSLERLVDEAIAEARTNNA